MVQYNSDRNRIEELIWINENETRKYNKNIFSKYDRKINITSNIINLFICTVKCYSEVNGRIKIH